MPVNTIKEYLEEGGIESIRPSDEQLEEWGITLHLWNKWVNKKSDPTLPQLCQVAEFLKCEPWELIKEVDKKSVKL